MIHANASWILVEGSNPTAIQHAILDHSQLEIPVEPQCHRVYIIEIDSTQYAVRFDPALPPIAFTSLIGWLGDSEFTKGVRQASGWLTAQGSGIRYFLLPERSNSAGDTLLGVARDGSSISVYLPDCSVRQCTPRVTFRPEPALPTHDFAPAASFEITVDNDSSFGNPQFTVQ
jgi:hypothetical protein